MRAILLASATATSIRGLRASILASQGSFVSPRRTAELTTAMAPMIKRRLRSRWPIFDILPSLGLPPVVSAACIMRRWRKIRSARSTSLGSSDSFAASAAANSWSSRWYFRASCGAGARFVRRVRPLWDRRTVSPLPLPPTHGAAAGTFQIASNSQPIVGKSYHRWKDFSLSGRIRDGGIYVVPAGALDDDPGETPERIVYWASRAPWFVHTDTLATNDE